MPPRAGQTGGGHTPSESVRARNAALCPTNGERRSRHKAVVGRNSSISRPHDPLGQRLRRSFCFLLHIQSPGGKALKDVECLDQPIVKNKIEWSLGNEDSDACWRISLHSGLFAAPVKRETDGRQKDGGYVWRTFCEQGTRRFVSW